MYTVQNIVCTCNLGSTLYLPGLVQALRVAEYNPKRFAAVTYRLRYPRSTCLIFGSGRLVCAGTKTLNQARLALLYYVDAVRKTGLQVDVYEFRVQNMVASATLPHGLDLGRIFTEHSEESSYEPELFPGLIFRGTVPCVFLLFDSGRMVITGGKNEAQIAESYAFIVPLVKGFSAPRGRGASRVHKSLLRQHVPVEVLEEDWAYGAAVSPAATEGAETPYEDAGPG